MTSPAKVAPYKKKNVPKALREALWISFSDSTFVKKCATNWCTNQINAYSFQAGHNIPESKGGPTTLENLIPLCSRCNQSMGNNYTFDEWQKLGKYPKVTTWPEPSVPSVKPSLWCC